MVAVKVVAGVGGRRVGGGLVRVRDGEGGGREACGACYVLRWSEGDGTGREGQDGTGWGKNNEGEKQRLHPTDKTTVD